MRWRRYLELVVADSDNQLSLIPAQSPGADPITPAVIAGHLMAPNLFDFLMSTPTTPLGSMPSEPGKLPVEWQSRSGLDVIPAATDVAGFLLPTKGVLSAVGAAAAMPEMKFLLNKFKDVPGLATYLGKISPNEVKIAAKNAGYGPTEAVYDALHEAGVTKQGASALPHVSNTADSAINEHGQLDLDKVAKYGPSLGSNPGGSYTDAAGNMYYIKNVPSSDHMANEHLAADLYKLAGVKTFDYVPTTATHPVVATKWQKLDVGSAGGFNADEMADAKKHFAAHAWLANWDVPGLDYTNLAAHEGKSIVTDTGGALMYRAQGELKPNFGNGAPEWDSMRDPNVNPQSYAVFGDMTDEELKASAHRVGAVNDDDIRTLVDKHGFTPGLADKIINRKYDILNNADVPYTVSEPKLIKPGGTASLSPGDVAWQKAEAAASTKNVPYFAETVAKHNLGDIADIAENKYNQLAWEFEQRTRAAGLRIPESLRQEWARRGGFTTPAYHGSRSGFEDTELRLDPHFYSSNNPNLANMYSTAGMLGENVVKHGPEAIESVAAAKGGVPQSSYNKPASVPLLLNTNNYHTVDAGGMTWERATSGTDWGSWMREAREKDAEGLVIHNLHDEPEGSTKHLSEPSTVYVTLPKGSSTVRSKFAKFDPAKWKLDDLLASGLAVSVPAGAAAHQLLWHNGRLHAIGSDGKVSENGRL